MTDDLSRELEDVAGSVPAMPNDFAALKALIQTLPSPLAPELRAAQQGFVASTEPGTAAAQLASTLAGAEIGQQSGASIGSIGEIFYGNANALTNPTLTGIKDELVAAYPSGTDVAHGWDAYYVVNSGSSPSAVGVGGNYGRGLIAVNPLNTVMLYLGADLPTGASDISIYLHSTTFWSPSIDPGLSYIVAAMKVALFGEDWAGMNPSLTKARVRIELMDNTGGAATLLAAGEWLDLLTLAGESGLWRFSAATPRPSGGWWSESYVLRLRFDLGKSASAGTYNVEYNFGEPVLAFSASQQPPPYSPIVAGWNPSVLTVRTEVGTSLMTVGGDHDIPTPDTRPRINWHDSSGAIDLYLSRLAAGTLKINAGSGIDESLAIGDDALLYDIDVADMLGIKGQATAANGGFVFGSGKDTNLYRSAANTLKTDDAFQAASLAIGTNKVARYVPLATTIQVVNGGTTTGDTGVVTSAEMTALPSTGVVAVHVTLIAITSVAHAGTFVRAFDYNGDTASTPLIVYAPPVAAYNAATTGRVETGGTNNRQMKYQATEGGTGTLTYYVRVHGYWTTE